MPKYQGKELQSTLQAPTESSLQEMVESARGFAEENKLEEFKILEFGKDPDGGYRAIVTAHNWNPISWIKEKLTRKKPEEEEGEEVVLEGDMTEEEIEASRRKLLAESSPEAGWEEADRLRGEKKEIQDQLAKETEERRQREEESTRAAKDTMYWRQYGSERGTKETPEEHARRTLGATEAARLKHPGVTPELTEEEVAKLPRGQRKEYRRRVKESGEAGAQAAFEIWKEGVPEAITQYHKTLQKEYWTDKDTGQPVPEPRTAEERARSDYHPSQWTFQPVERKLSSPERLAVARTLELEGMELEVARDKYKQFKRERHPAYRAAKAAGGFGQFMAGAVTLGVAGVARGAQPGRGGPARAARMHAPGVPMELYAVRPVLGVGMPTAKDLTGSGLGHLRALTLPGIRRTRKQVGLVRRTVEQR